MNLKKNLKEEIEIIRAKGYNVIGVSLIGIEDTFIFETKEEALKAYLQLDELADLVDKIDALWVSKNDFKKKYSELKKKGTKLKVEWLDPLI